MRQEKTKDKRKTRRQSRTEGKQTAAVKVRAKAAGGKTRRPGANRKQSRRTRAHLRQASRTAAGRRHLPAPRRGEPNRPNSGSKSPAHTSARRANGKQAPAAQARPDQAQKQQAACRLGTRRRNTGRKMPEHRAQKPTGQTAAGFEKAASPANGAARRVQKNPSEQAKFAFALLPARRGHANRGRQKFASLFLAGTVFFCFALRIAQNKRGRRPLLSPASFLKKA